MISVGKVMTCGIDPLLATQTVGEVRLQLANSTLPGLPVVNHAHKVLGVMLKNCELSNFSGDMPLVKW